MYDHGDGLKFCESVAIAPKDANVIVGAVIRVPPPIPGVDVSQINAICRFFPGEMVGDNFVPGQRMASANGEFIPAASIRSGNRLDTDVCTLTSIQLKKFCKRNYVDNHFIFSHIESASKSIDYSNYYFHLTKYQIIDIFSNQK